MRAVRAQLAFTHGAESPLVILPFGIHEVPEGGSGVNWEIEMRGEPLAPESFEAARSAAALVSHRYFLEQHHH